MKFGIFFVVFTLCFCDRNSSLAIDTPSSSNEALNQSSSQKSLEQNESSTVVLAQLSSGHVESNNSFISSASIQDSFISCESHYHSLGIMDSIINLDKMDSITTKCFSEKINIYNDRNLFFKALVDNQKPYSVYSWDNTSHYVSYAGEYAYSSKASSRILVQQYNYGDWSNYDTMLIGENGTINNPLVNGEPGAFGRPFSPDVGSIYSITDSTIVYSAFGSYGSGISYIFDSKYGVDYMLRAKDIQGDSLIIQTPVNFRVVNAIINNGVLFGFGLDTVLVTNLLMGQKSVFKFYFPTANVGPYGYRTDSIWPIELMDSTVLFSDGISYRLGKIKTLDEKRMYEQLLTNREVNEQKLVTPKEHPVFNVSLYYCKDPVYFPYGARLVGELDSLTKDSLYGVDYSVVDSLRISLDIYFKDFSEGTLYATISEDYNGEKIYIVDPQSVYFDCGNYSTSSECKNEDVTILDYNNIFKDHYIWYKSAEGIISGPYFPSINLNLDIDWPYKWAKEQGFCPNCVEKEETK